ncbi:MAG: AtpZ/AtpI family protein [Flavobacterium sp.]
MQPNSNKPKPNKWLALLNIPIQMGAVIFLFAYLGHWLDDKYPNPKVYYVKILVVLGVFLALYNVHRQVKEINKNQ